VKAGDYAATHDPFLADIPLFETVAAMRVIERLRCEFKIEASAALAVVAFLDVPFVVVIDVVGHPETIIR
jgi:hypothetical protein